MKKQYIKLLITVIIFCMAGLLYRYERKPLEGLSQTGQSETALQLQTVPAETQAFQESNETIEYVYICGEVHSPGVYSLPSGSRIFELVELAGGFTADADPTHLNLAQVVSDGIKIVVLSKTEAAQWGNQAVGAELLNDQPVKVNLNEASKELLMTLRGIGESRAEDIIRYREQHGRFKTIEDIMQVSGIKESVFEKIKDDITV